MAGNVKRQRNKIIQRNPNAPCFYCGFGFDHSIFNNAPQKGAKGYRKFKRRVALTAEHLHPASQGGKGGSNIVVAHACCNRMAGNMPIIEKYKFVGAIRETLEWQQKVGKYMEKIACQMA